MVFIYLQMFKLFGINCLFLLMVHDECAFYVADLQLDVKGCRDVYASFDKYVEVERLEGDNKYHAEEHGLQVSWCELIGTRY